MAPLTPGHASAQATATDETLAWCRDAMGRSASRSARLRSTLGDWNSGLRRRQSSGASEATRAALKRSVRMPDCIGL
jgi:hypothetical protein